MTRLRNVGNMLLGDFVGGVLATVPMTLLMLAANRMIPAKKPDPLPPEEITKNLTEKTQAAALLSEPQKKRLSLVNHFLYGGLIATPVGWMVANTSARQAMNRGIGYGLLVWAGNYLGLLPTLNLYPSATREPARMNGIMIVSHLVWGGSLGWFSHRFQSALIKSR